jgi:hypothetical protein
MKRTPLLRKTPLRPKVPYRWKGRLEETKVTAELREYILDRDKVCLAWRVDHTHQCRTRFGQSHAPDERKHLRLAHVKDNARMGLRAPSDARHLVAECDAANETWSSANRVIERAYLAVIERDS